MNDMKNWDKKLTVMQGYNAMRQFLEAFGTLTYSKDILGLYKRTELLGNGITADPVVYYKWTWCVNEALTEKKINYFGLCSDGSTPIYKKIEYFPEIMPDQNQILTYLQAYVAMQKFIDIDYFDAKKPNDLGSLAGSMGILEFDEDTVDSAMWEDWLDAVEVVLKRENNDASNK